MGIPHKRSRRIEVDGTWYAYLIKEVRDPDLPRHARSVRVVVQENTERPGRVLRACFFHGEIVTPTVVDALVHEGRALGWDPSEPGGAFDMPPDRRTRRHVEGQSFERWREEVP